MPYHLKRQPVTEKEFYLAIFSVTRDIWWYKHDSADGRFKETPATKRDIKGAKIVALRLINKACKKFGLVKNPAVHRDKNGTLTEKGQAQIDDPNWPPKLTDGKKYISDWYKKWEEKIKKEQEKKNK